MSRFKVGDEVVAIRAFPIIGLSIGDKVVVMEAVDCDCGKTGIYYGVKIPPRFCEVQCDCGYRFSKNDMYVHQEFFDKPRHVHTKSTIRNQQVLKRLATLPQISERIEQVEKGAEV